MTKQNEDIGTVFSGNTVVIENTITNGEGPPRDVTDDDVLFTLMENPGSDPIIVKKTEDAGVTKPSPTDGVVSVRLNSEETKQLSSKTYYYHVTLSDSTGQVATVTTGQIEVRRGYTND